MYKKNNLTSFFSLIFLTSLVNGNIEYDGILTIKLEHNLFADQKAAFTNRGNITIQSLRLGQSTIHHTPLTNSDRDKIRDLAANNKFYSMKATVNYDDSEASFISTIKACMLAEAELNDIISIYLDYSGKVISVTNVIASTSTCEGAKVPLDKLQEFTTSVFVRHTLPGPTPDTATYVQQMEREREARERGESKDNRSFLAKYWMYIIPVVIIMVLSSAANPDAAGGGAAATR